MPYPAGIIIPILFFVITFLFVPLSSNLFRPLIGFLIASIILVIICFIDDKKEISPFFRLIIQFIIALIILASGIGISEIRTPLGEIMNLDFWSFEFLGKTVAPIADFIAVLWIIGMINAMNWLDGVSGLTSSISSVASTILAITAYMFGQHDIALLFGVLAVICLIFFIFDLEKPKILMGDSGAMFLGFALAVFTIIAGGKFAIAMIVMFAPIFDAIWTVSRRLIKGKSPFKGDYGHLHHKLLERIGSRKKVVILYSSLVSIFGFTSLYFETLGKIVIIFILIVFLTVLEIFLHSKN